MTTPAPDHDRPDRQNVPDHGPVGSTPLNADSTSINGLEVGKAHDDQDESAQLTAHLLQQANSTLQAHEPSKE